MIQLSEKTPGETFCEQEEMVPEDKELSTLVEYLRWTFSGPNVDIFKEHLGLILGYQDWFDSGDRQYLRAVYGRLLRVNSHLAGMREWRIEKLRGSDAYCDAELTAYYSGIAESNIEKAVERSDSQPMVLLAQQCITLCDHLVRQAYLLEETKAAIEEVELSDWLKKQSETEWEPGISSFNSDLSHATQPSPEPLTTESQESEEVALSSVHPPVSQSRESVSPIVSSKKPAKDLDILLSVLIIAFGLSAGVNLVLIHDRVNPPEEKAHERQELVSYANNLLAEGRAVRP